MAWYTMKDNSGKELADKLNIIFTKCHGNSNKNVKNEISSQRYF